MANTQVLERQYTANSGKRLKIEFEDSEYMRLPIKTHFVKVGEDYLQIIKDYVMPQIESNDVLIISEKIIALCQNRVIYKDELKVGWLAKMLSRFVWKNPHAEGNLGLRNVNKMQAAIYMKGPLLVLYAAFMAAIGKVFRIRGVFYKILGREVAGIDGFNGDGYEYYADKGTLLPKDPTEVCSRIKESFGIESILVDANDLGVEILGKSPSNPLFDETVKALIKDNPAGQSDEQTPFILIRKAA